MIAKNFKFLYKHFKDKQTVLAKMFHVSQSDISYYQNGKKEIPIDILNKISIRYNVSIDDLTNKDLSLEYDLPQAMEIDDVQNFGENIFPILTSNIAKANDDFNRAYKKLFETLQCDDVNILYERIGILEHVITLFQRSWDESHTYVGISNSISVVLLIYALYSQRGIKICQELLTKKTLSFYDIQCSFLHDPNKPIPNNPYERQKNSFFEKYEEFVYNNIKLLKSNLSFSELGDYYLAMCYFLGFTEDYIEYEMSTQVGIYMLTQMCKLENKYAEKFIESLSKIS